jgi:hypothetical protein
VKPVLDPIVETTLPPVTGVVPPGPSSPTAVVVPVVSTPPTPPSVGPPTTAVLPIDLGAPPPPGGAAPFFGDIQDFMEAGGSESGLLPSVGMLALLPDSVVALWSAAHGIPVSIDSTGHIVFGVGSGSSPGSPDAPPSHPSPERPAPPAQAPAGGATAAGGSGGTGLFSGTLFAALCALMGLAALSTSRLAMASAQLRPQAYIALLERPG